MYIPYRKAYISGMNPLSFVTVFTFGELGTVFALALVFGGGYNNVVADLSKARPVLFWLFLGGFCRGLAWGMLVFGELANQSATAQTLVIAGSLIMIAGAAAITVAEAPEREHTAGRLAIERECERYGMDLSRVEASMRGEDVLAARQPRRHWWASLVAAAAVGIFVWLGLQAERAPIHFDPLWMAILGVATLALLVVCGMLLWRRTRFS